MSKSRGNFLDPNDFVAAFGSDGARYVVLREVPFDRDAEVSWDSFVRRYNADLANDFGNLVNRTVSMTNRYLDGERPGPASGGESRRSATAWARRSGVYRAAFEACLLHDALAELWAYIGAAEQGRRRRAAMGAGQGRKAGDAAAGERLRGVLGDLVEACRLRRAGGRAVPARRPRRASSASSATPTRTRPTATAARRSSASSRGAAHAAEPGG